uniref:Uncharacterized protein n=1 Tax=Kalmanozyma brasiliensis (strain GHG001) TaxID=1365824 RepID=V5GLM1_KALBG
MLQSNTDATSFKLQPAPRPKSKKRPQNPPPVLTLSPNASASTDGADTKSLRSCFEDEDEAITPKASSFHIFLDDKHDVSDSDATISSRRLRSSSTSISSATSTKSLSSVNRLLSALSPTTPTRRPQSLTSPSATVTVMLTNKSPTPSSPLFPRRTLMRSLSSTCVNIRSPTTPLTPSPGATLRKRMGWRGAQSAQLADETAIIMSPGSPLTPRRADALHTPTQASISSIPENEPLSATLKALGAKRRTERFASTCAPLLSPDGADVKSPNSEKFELMTATRKIFHLPTWVRFEAKHHARTQAAEENRQAAAGFEELRKKISTESMMEYVVMRGEALPKTNWIGETRLDTWHTRPLKPSHEEESVSSEMITRGGRSVENRPLGKKKGLRTRIVMAAVIVMIVAAVVANVVIIAQARKVSQGQGDKGRMAYDPLVGRIGPGFVLPPTMTTTVPDARSSSVARAAQLSQP